MRTIEQRVITFLLLAYTLMLVPSAVALGISQDYHENQTLFITQGETSVHHITIQNDLPIALPVKFTVTGDYASVNGAQELMLAIPEKSINTIVSINITVPDDAPANSTHAVTYTIQPVIEGSGTVNMAVRLSDSFTIFVKERPRAWWPPYAIGAGVLLLLCLVFFIGVRWASARHGRASRHERPLVRETAKEPRRQSTLGRTEHDLILAVAEMDDKTLEARMRSGEIAQAAFERTKNPETYHKVKVARNRKELLRALREE